MRVYPKPLEIGDEEGFSTGKDLFGKSKLAEGMSNLVATVEDPLVIAFDGQWGSGKTTFLKMWAGELRKSGHPVIFFDAFENDYVEDAFAALAREIIELAEKLAPEEKKVAQSIREKASKLGTLLLKGSAKIGAKVAVRAATAGLASADDFKDISKDINEELEEAAEAYMDQLLDQPRKQKQIAESFRQALTELPGLISPPTKGDPQKPLIFIIDELDRCKPLFALALLERLKHFMAVQNIHFVLGVHLNQLHSAVKYSYGRDTNSISYLQKFINITIINTERIEEDKNLDLHKYSEYLVKSLGIKVKNQDIISETTETFIRVIQNEQMSYRTLERAFTTLAICIAMTHESQLQTLSIMGGLIIMKLIRVDLYIKAKRGTLDLKEAKNFLRFEPDERDEKRMGWEEKAWTYFLSEPVPEYLSDFRQVIFQNGVRLRPNFIKYFANEILDKLVPS